MERIVFKPIGVIHSPFTEPKGTPIQPAASRGSRGTVEVFSEYAAGLKDVEGFSHIILIFFFHLIKKVSLIATPYLDTEKRGIFAIRGPGRPNPIGISTVKLIGRRDNILEIENVDMVDGTPLLDIKPYVPEFDLQQEFSLGWLEKKIEKLPRAKDDGRFAP
ncbi:MAG: tRNA (N6-threonylcarbamoyladenosine(37)-N6)-methyltransferase TrmO [Candidatus Krumholzibacteriota bacterium]|nr:tRNA (N6-threonylcarbamoyladenosine(37)-N6)-methyltransferase TrmO [Candidatus Krumholzibacteriota bacterium]